MNWISISNRRPKCTSFIFIMLELVFLNGCAVGSAGGYFVNLLKFPSLCPLTSFCAAWNPTGPDKSITLIDHGKIKLAVDGIHILSMRGRIKKNNVACWSKNRHANNDSTQGK